MQPHGATASSRSDGSRQQRRPEAAEHDFNGYDSGGMQYEARMAESVDALVSNTSGETRAGSTPAPGTEMTS